MSNEKRETEMKACRALAAEMASNVDKILQYHRTYAGHMEAAATAMRDGDVPSAMRFTRLANEEAANITATNGVVGQQWHLMKHVGGKTYQVLVDHASVEDVREQIKEMEIPDLRKAATQHEHACGDDACVYVQALTEEIDNRAEQIVH